MSRQPGISESSVPVGNTKDFLVGVLHRLERHGIESWVFGGWGDELRGLAAPRAHKDIDLLYPAQDFAQIDRLFACSPDIKEITAKRFAHKRAFELDGIMVELFLVQSQDEKLCTDFWGYEQFTWPEDTFSAGIVDGLRVASSAALRGYRAYHAGIATPSTMQGSVDGRPGG